MTITRNRRVLLAAGALVAIASVAWLAPASGASAEPKGFDILVFERTAGFRHPSIPYAVEAIEALGVENRFNVDVTADQNFFTAENLAKYEALVFVSTTGNVLPLPSQRAALEGYIRAGGGYFGLHAASDMGGAVRDGWPFYRDLVGAAFRGHTSTTIWSANPLAGTNYGGPYATAPADAEEGTLGFPLRYKSWEPALMIVEDPGARMMHGFGDTEVREDEWYGFRSNPREHVHVLASLDEGSYNEAAGDMGEGDADHPITWCQNYEGGRSVYTGLGHPIAAWSDDLFLRHVLGGIHMAAGVVPFHCD